MKIVVISNLYKPYARGGAEVVVARTIESLEALGHEVVLITGQPLFGRKVEPEQNTKIIRYYPWNIFFYRNDHKFPFFIRIIWHLIDLFNVQSAIRVKRLLKQESPDIVLSHNLMGLGYLVPWSIRSLGLKHVHILHDIQLAVRSGVMKKGEEDKVISLFSRIYQFIVRKQFGSPDLVISPSHYLLDFYKQLGFFPLSKLEVLRNPIDKQFFLKSTESLDKQREFLLISQMVKHKGIKTLLDALKKVESTDFRLTMIGDGPLLLKVKQFALKDKRFNIVGRVSNDKIPDYLRITDCVLVPTETYENSPTVIYEALAASKPVICTDIGGTAELIEEGVTGYTFQPGNSEQLAKKMLMMIKHPLNITSSPLEGYETTSYCESLVNRFNELLSEKS